MAGLRTLGLNWLDVVILLVLLLGIIRGLRAGFIRLLLGLVGFVLGFWGASTWARSAVQLSERSFRAVTVLASVIRRYIDIPTDVALMPIKAISPSDIMAGVRTLPLPPDLKTSIARYLNSLLSNMNTVPTATVGDFLYKAFASLCLHAVAFLLILYIIRGIALVMADVLSQTFAQGSAGALTNGLLGAALGLAQSAISLVAIIGLLTPLVNLSPSADLARVFATSRIAPALSRSFMWAVSRFGGGF